MNKLIWHVKQLFPLLYYSEYKDTKGVKYVSIWRQWFGKVLFVKKYKVFN